MSLKIISLNCNGIRDYDKRTFLFNYLKVLECDIVFLQETHCDNIKLAKSWGNNWDGKCFWSFGSNKSSGVAILVGKQIVERITSFDYDIDGRVIAVKMKFNDIVYQFVNIYAPNGLKERKQFINDLYQWIEGDHIVLGGDFNFVEDLTIDKEGGSMNFGDCGKDEMNDVKRLYKLVDPFRKMYPQTKEFTWCNAVTKCRLDRFYVSKEIWQCIKLNVRHVASLRSDHGMVMLDIEGIRDVVLRGEGYWKCNKEVLEDELLKEDMGTLWVKLLSEENKDLAWWEECKDQCKYLIIEHSKRLSNLKKSKQRVLKNRIRYLSNLEKKSGVENTDEINSLKEQLDFIMKKKMEGARIRAKSALLVNEEKPSKYYVKKERQRVNIEKLETSRGEITDKGDIVKEVRDFYKTLFSEEEVDESKIEYFLEGIVKLSNCERDVCEGKITKKEVYEALKLMSVDKSPGCDGLTCEFYEEFIHLFDEAFVDMINLCFKEGTMAYSQRLATITLICKNVEKSEFLSNWRPISLLNLDYKIISKVLSVRLSKVLSKIVNVDQTCSIVGRSIVDNLHLMRNTVDYVNQKDMNCAVLSLDQIKAFDRVAYKFLDRILQAVNFGPDFQRWIRVLYTDILSQVEVNGHLTEPFEVKRGVRQGCSLSPMLYVLFMEPFANKVREDKNIVGLKMPGTKDQVKISQYADDTNIVITTLRSGYNVFKLIDLFGMASGSKLNLDKSWGIWLGKWKNRSDKPFGIQWTNDSRKICGILVGNGDVVDKSWERVIEKLEDGCKLANMRNVTFKARSNLIQAVIGSKIWYTGTVLVLPEKFAKQLETIVFKFFWGKLKESVAREVMYMNYLCGGFSVVNVRVKVEALHVKHIISLFSTEAKWKYFAIYWIGMSLRLLEGTFALNDRPHCIEMPSFYGSAMESFRKITMEKNELVKLKTRDIYRILLKQREVIPNVVNKYPTIDFTEAWKNVHCKVIDPFHRDIAWRIMYQVLPVNMYLYTKNISKYCDCHMCPAVESLAHLFIVCPVVKALWKYVEQLICDYTKRQVLIDGRLIMFNVFSKAESEEHNVLLLLLVSIGRYCIWTCRNLAKFDKVTVTNKSLICMFISQLRVRIFSDVISMEKTRFHDRWCKGKTFVNVVGDKIKVVLKPP